MRHLLCIVLLLAALNAHADKRLFYQPLNADATLSQAQWREIWQASVANGVQTIVVQWTRFGDEDFGGADGWLARTLREADAQGLQLVLGLYYAPDYYQQLAARDDIAYYWHQQLGLSLQQQQRLSRDWRLPVSGWYLPMELDDWNYRDSARREELQRQLVSFAGQLDQPLHLSAFSGAFLSPGVYAEWLDGLAQAGMKVWWQDGVGTGVLAPLVRLAYASALPCRIGFIREAYRQTSLADQPFMAVPGRPLAWSPCHATAVFELRYRSWGQVLYRNQHGAQRQGREPLLMRPLPRLPLTQQGAD